MTTVTLDDRQLEQTRRAMRDTLDLLDRLGWPEQDRVAGDTPSTEPNRV